MTDFKQIIGRGTRVREDYGKLFFNILDYTGSATRLFADPDFDGEPALIDEEVIDAEGEVVEQTVVEDESQGDEDGAVEIVLLEFSEQEPPEQRKYYFDGGSVEIAAQVVYELDARRQAAPRRQLHRLRARQGARPCIARPKRSNATGASASSGARSSTRSRSAASTWSDSARSPACPTPIRSICSATSRSTGRCAPVASAPSDSPEAHEDFFDRYGADARAILEELVDKYAEHGLDQLRLPDVLKVPPLSAHGNPSEIASIFGGPEQLREAVDELEELLYAA